MHDVKSQMNGHEVNETAYEVEKLVQTHLEKQKKIIKQIDIQTEVFGKQAKQWMKEVENNLKC